MFQRIVWTQYMGCYSYRHELTGRSGKASIAREPCAHRRRLVPASVYKLEAGTGSQVESAMSDSSPSLSAYISTMICQGLCRAQLGLPRKQLLLTPRSGRKKQTQRAGELTAALEEIVGCVSESTRAGSALVQRDTLQLGTTSC